MKCFIILNDNQDIMGLYNNIDITLNIVLDNYILQFTSILEVLKQNNFFKINHINNSYKIKELLINSNVTIKEIYFCFKNFNFYDNNKNQNYFNDDDYSFCSKINKLKKLYNNIISINDNDNFNIFIPNNIFGDTISTNKNIFGDNISINKNVFSDNLSKNDNVIDNNEKKIFSDNISKNENVIDNSEKKAELLNILNKLEKNEKKINSQIKDIQENITETDNDISKNLSINKNLNKLKDNYNNLRNRFDSNIKIYIDMKEKIDNKEINIPDMFESDFKIFKYFNDNNIEDKEEQFLYYQKNLVTVKFYEED